MLLITHDLRAAAQVCDDVIVLQNGRIVESGAIDAVFSNPGHAYTRRLVEAQPGRERDVPGLEVAGPRGRGG